MSRRLLAASLVLSLLPLSPAYAWDPERQAPQPPPPDEAAAPAPPDGLHVVTDVYVADVVTRSGARTTYATTTVRQTPGTYARVLQTVGTGERSGLDERSANTRLALADGRLAAGTYYETFVPSDAGLASVGVVFFHDDAELARERSSPAPVGQGARSATPEDGLRAGLSPLSQGEPLTRLEV
ncbi:MAG: hypothetical protein ACRDF0_01540, partial [Candidatus Limnocylindria bacterium]